jgi:DNA-binding response OmpR family regulator
MSPAPQQAEAARPQGPEVIRVGRLEIRPREFVAAVDGRALDLTVRELQLLTALARRLDRIVTREELYTAVWQRPFRKDERSVDVYVKRLRRKIGAVLPGSEYIHTHYGFGYRFSSSHSQLFHTAATDR